VYVSNIDGDVTVALDADDCLTLARACNLAQWTIGTESHAGWVCRLFNLPKPGHMMLDTYVSLPWQKNEACSTPAGPIFRPPTDTFSLEA
jgi:hypothetical protein